MAPMRVSVRTTVQFLALSLVMGGALTACHTSTHEKRDPHRPLTYNERTAGQKGDSNKVSKFDKMLNSSALGDRGAMKAVGKKTFGTDEYKGNTKYSGTKAYQTKDFAQAGKPNSAQTKMSAMGTQKSKVSDKIFATTDSRWSGKAAQGNDKAFKNSTQQYKTGDYGAAKKSIEDNKRPYFAPATGLDKSKTYDEEAVRTLLNRN